MIKTKIIKDHELPFRIQIDKLQGASTTPAGAVMAALSAGRKIPKGMRDREVAGWYIFWNYEPKPDRDRLIHILNKNTFKEEKS